jgi:hypothetical protein
MQRTAAWTLQTPTKIGHFPYNLSLFKQARPTPDTFKPLGSHATHPHTLRRLAQVHVVASHVTTYLQGLHQTGPHALVRRLTLSVHLPSFSPEGNTSGVGDQTGFVSSGLLYICMREPHGRYPVPVWRSPTRPACCSKLHIANIWSHASNLSCPFIRVKHANHPSIGKTRVRPLTKRLTIPQIYLPLMLLEQSVVAGRWLSEV